VCGHFEPALINRVLEMHRARNPALCITLHWGPCDRPRTTREKKHLPHGSEIFPAARHMKDDWPFWYSIGGPPEGVRPRVFLNLRRTHQ
jgi:hypothetical protein